MSNKYRHALAPIVFLYKTLNWKEQVAVMWCSMWRPFTHIWAHGACALPSTQIVHDNIKPTVITTAQLCSRRMLTHPAQSDSGGRSQKRTGWSRSRSVAGRGTATEWRPSYVCEEWARSGWAPWCRSPARCLHRPHLWPKTQENNVKWD